MVCEEVGGFCVCMCRLLCEPFVERGRVRGEKEIGGAEEGFLEVINIKLK